MKYYATWKEENTEMEYTGTIWNIFSDAVEKLVLTGIEVTIRYE